MKALETIKIGISGARGVVGETMTPEFAARFSRAFATLLGGGKVAVGCDSRPSGDMLRHAVFAGLCYSGLTPVDTGVLATPTLQILVREARLAGGIIVTASHNPEEWNGLKFVNEEGLFLPPFTALHLIDLYHQGSFSEPQQNRFPEVEQEAEAFHLHMRKILHRVDPLRIRKRRLRVLADPGGGVGGRFDRELLEALGCEVDVLHEEAGAHFPRPPEPLPENLGAARARMAGGGFDVGFAQDADGDRLCVLDETGRPLGGEMSLALALSGFLAGQRGGTVVVNLSTSNLSRHVARTHGARLVRSPVGEINVVERMRRENAVAGGEGNGGVIVPAVHPCRDSFTGMALVLDLLARENQPLSALVAGFPPYRMESVKLPFTSAAAHRLLSLLAEEYPGADTSDGLRVEEGERWFHVRASNTEPVLRIVAEGPGDEAGELVGRLRERIRQLEAS